MLPALDDLLQYTNTPLFARYHKDNPSNTLPAQEALQHLLRYFWLCQKLHIEKQERPEDPTLDFTCVVHKEMRQIDDMWHTFLLFTKDYMDFCYHYFGKYLHHAPASEEDKKMRPPEVVELELRRHLTYIEKHLGQETLMVWFKELF